MAKTKISEFSSTPANNTDIDSINIAEGCAPSNINDAIRELMAQLKDFQIGSQGDSFNGPIGTSTAAAGAFTTLTASSTLGVTGVSTLTGGAVVQGLTVGRGAGAVATNTAVGASALQANTTGADNFSGGYQSLYSNTTGNANSAIGRGAIYSNTTGSNNTALGYTALANNTTASSNTAVGYQAGYTNSTGAEFTAVGYQALYLNTGSWSTAVGNQALRNNTSGTNAAFGQFTLYSNSTGTANAAFGGYGGSGSQTMVSNTTGSYNTAMGMGALAANTTASNNTAVGYQAGYSNTVGGSNTFIGQYAGYTFNPGSAAETYNTFVGRTAGYATTTGTYNTFVGPGSGAGFTITTGSKNTILGGFNGNQGGLDIRTASNYIVLSDGDGNIGAYARNNISGTGTSQFHINNQGGQYTELMWDVSGVNKAEIWWDNSALRLQTYTTTNGPYLSNGGTSWTNSSDERLKNITGEIQNALTKVCSLRAAEYTWKADETATPQVGLIAQDVLAVLPQAVDIPPEGATEKDGSPAMMGVQYTDVIPLLVAAIKELKAEIDTLKGN